MKKKLAIAMGLFIMGLSIILNHGQNMGCIVADDEVIEWNSYSIEKRV